MKHFKTLGIIALLAVLVVAAILVKNNMTASPATTEPSTQVKDVKTKTENITKVVEENPKTKTENIVKVVEENPKTNEEASEEEMPEPNTNTPETSITVPEIAEGDIAMVATVYPRLPDANNDPCLNDTDNSIIWIQKFDDGTILCDMSDEQLKEIQDSGFEGRAFCECLFQFCGETNKAAEFLQCLKE